MRGEGAETGGVAADAPDRVWPLGVAAVALGLSAVGMAFAPLGAVAYAATPWVVLATFWAYTHKRPRRRLLAASSVMLVVGSAALLLDQLAGIPDLSAVSSDAAMYSGVALLLVLPVIALATGVIGVSAAWPRRAG